MPQMVIAHDLSKDGKKVKIPIKEAFKGKGGKYYSTPEAAEWSFKRSKYQCAMYDIMGMIINDKPIKCDKDYLENITQYYELPSSYKKMLNEMGEKYTYTWTLAFLMDKEFGQEKLLWAVRNKFFNNDWNESRYLGAIIDNNIRFFMNKKMAEDKERERQNRIAEEQEDYDDEDITNFSNAQSSDSVHDISSFLSEDE